MELKILCVLTLLNIAMLLLNIWLRLDSEETLAEIKKTDCHGLRPRNDRERSGFDEISQND